MHSATTEDTSWRTRAACRGLTGLFYPSDQETREQQTAAAQAVCARCPVAEQCLAHAVEHNERYGIWGGAAPRERRRLRREWYAHQVGQRCSA